MLTVFLSLPLSIGACNLNLRRVELPSRRTPPASVQGDTGTTGATDSTASTPIVPASTPIAPDAMITRIPRDGLDATGASADPARAVSSLTGVRNATLRIEADGSFMDPKVGMQFNEVGSGSGFLIDPSGLAVTNNHVVTGAAFLKVWVGDELTPRQAKILGVSECSDLAVIDLEGDGYPFLAWYDGVAEPGLEVFAAGFPLGEPEFTLSRGIITRQHADGKTHWASVDTVLEHDAPIKPGSSGGPLVTVDGRVVGINYANDIATQNHFAIAREEAVPVIAELKAGRNVTAIGVNGIAVADRDGHTGVWVSSVQTGSPADRLGLLPGDILTKLEGLILATHGTMAEYCDILRAHSPTETLGVEVLRYTTQEVMEGQLNGERRLEQGFAFARDVGVTAGLSAELRPGRRYTDFTTQTDESGAISLEVPNAWSDVNFGRWSIDGKEVGVQVRASSDLAKLGKVNGTSGVFFGASKVLAAKYDAPGLIEFDKGELDVGGCEYNGRKDYEDSYYKGVYDVYQDCGGEKAGIIVLSAMPADKSVILLLAVKVVSDADLDALDRIVGSFQLVGDLP